MVSELWIFLPQGFLLTVAIELPVLLIGLSKTHLLRTRLIAGCWLTACTYPIVALVLPLTVIAWWGQATYLVIAETFAPLAECLVFRAAFPIPGSKSDAIRDVVTIIAANLISFIAGLWIFAGLHAVAP
jgi:hypothetical protein